mgnify:CR=1 FL=1
MKTYTVNELMQELLKAPPDAQVILIDADTSWHITKFEAKFDEKDGCFWFYPSDHSDMNQ